MARQFGPEALAAVRYLPVRALQEGGYLMWQPPHVQLTGKGKRALRLHAA